ncbi:hypothetical protein RSAG8_04825, partial [Rhizoctonia solani AG-8 WAC10335]
MFSTSTRSSALLLYSVGGEGEGCRARAHSALGLRTSLTSEGDSEGSLHNARVASHSLML